MENTAIESRIHHAVAVCSLVKVYDSYNLPANGLFLPFAVAPHQLESLKVSTRLC